MKTESQLFLWFYGGIFIAFGLGATLDQLIERFPSGYLFMGVGFLFLILSILNNSKGNKK